MNLIRGWHRIWNRAPEGSGSENLIAIDPENGEEPIRIVPGTIFDVPLQLIVNLCNAIESDDPGRHYPRVRAVKADALARLEVLREDRIA